MLRVHADLVDLTKELRLANAERAKVSQQLAVLSEQLRQLRPAPGTGVVAAVGTGAATVVVALVEGLRAYLAGRG